jgi:NUMOD3 motif
MTRCASDRVCHRLPTGQKRGCLAAGAGIAFLNPMSDADRYPLIGTYASPRFRYGKFVTCEMRGEVQLVGLTDAPIPWPIGKRGRHKAIVLYGDLVRAVRRESSLAIQHWFGVGPVTVWQWRRALGVDRKTEGTSRLQSENSQTNPGVIAGLAKAHGTAQDPERRARIAAAQRGKPRPRSAMEAAWEANRGRKHTAEARAKMSAAQRWRGARPPKAGRAWTAEEDALVRELPALEVASKTGRTLQAVYARRSVLGLNNGRTTRWRD